MLKLDERLEFVYEKIPFCDVLCDIGCDHGKLSCKVALEGKAKKVVAVDVSSKSLEKARNLFKKHNVEGKVDCRCGDGFSVVFDGENDVCVIAGMGGEEIIKILSCAKLKFNTYIFVPHQNAAELRVFLQGNGFNIKSDNIKSAKGKFYSVLVVSQGECVLTKKEILFGKDTDSKEFLSYLKARKAIIDSINAGFAKRKENIACQCDKPSCKTGDEFSDKQFNNLSDKTSEKIRDKQFKNLCDKTNEKFSDKHFGESFDKSVEKLYLEELQIIEEVLNGN